MAEARFREHGETNRALRLTPRRKTAFRDQSPAGVRLKQVGFNEMLSGN